MEKLPEITPQFKTFIISLLKRAGLKEANIKSFTDSKSMKEFRMAFTHKSYSSKFNYELFEFLGDLTLNWVVGNYIHDRWPDIINVDWLTKMKHALVSKKYLGMIAEKAGFYKFIVYSDEIKKELSGPNYKQNQIYKDMMEDTVEAFLGALKKVTDGKKRIGVSMALSYNIISSFLDELNIDAYDYELYYDPISRLKEISDARYWAGKDGFQKLLTFVQTAKGAYTASVVTYPFFTATGGKRDKITYKATGIDKQDAKRNVCLKALKALANTYNVKGKAPNHHQKNKWKMKRR